MQTVTRRQIDMFVDGAHYKALVSYEGSGPLIILFTGLFTNIVHGTIFVRELGRRERRAAVVPMFERPEARTREWWVDRLARRMAAIADQLASDQPFELWAHSAATAGALRLAGRPLTRTAPDRHVLLAAPAFGVSAAAHLGRGFALLPARPGERAQAVFASPLVSRLRSRVGGPGPREWLARLLSPKDWRQLRAAARVVVQPRPGSSPPGRSPVLVVAYADDWLCPARAVVRNAAAGYRIVVLPGDHNTVLRSPARTVDAIVCTS